LHIPGILLALSLLISLAFFLIMPPERVARTLFFPGATEAELSGERRLVPRVRDQEKAARLLADEMMLGPTRITLSRVFPRGTRVESLLLRNGVVYVDLNERAMIQSGEMRVDVRTGLAALRRTLLFNLRQLDEVVITINGNVPFAPAFRPFGR
jgi:hypothetical protein